MRVGHGPDAEVSHEVAGSGEETYVLLVSGGEVSGLRAEYEGGGAAAHSPHDAGGAAAVALPGDGRGARVSYTLLGAVGEDGGERSWDFSHPGAVRFAFPEGTEVAYINETPVALGGGALKVDCNGCDMVLTYADWPREARAVEAGGRGFEVSFLGFGEVGEASFDQEARSLSFAHEGAGRFLTVELPAGLLQGPYDVRLGGERILDHETEAGGGKAWVSVRPGADGELAVSGAAGAGWAPGAAPGAAPRAGPEAGGPPGAALWAALAAGAAAAGLGAWAALRRRRR